MYPRFLEQKDNQQKQGQGHMALWKHPIDFSHYFKYMSNPSPQKEEEMETVDTLFGRSLEVHHRHHSHSLNKDCIHICKQHKLPAISPLTALSSCTHTHTARLHTSLITQTDADSQQAQRTYEICVS